MAFNKKLTFEGLQYYHSKIKTLFSNTHKNISDEVTRATTAENTLTTNLNSEISRAKSAESTNATAISNEESRATTKENEIASNLSSHTSNTSNPHKVTKAQVGLGNVENKSSATIRGEITKSNVTTALGYTPLNQSLKGSASGLAELDSNGKVPSSQLPSFVDDVIEGYLSGGKFYKESAHTTEISGETGKIYIDLSTEKTYRWSGSAFVVISETLALGETSSTAYRGDRGKTAYDHSQSTHARTDATKVEKSSTNGNIKINGTETTVYTHPGGTNPHGTTKSDIGLGNVDNTKDIDKPISTKQQEKFDEINYNFGEEIDELKNDLSTHTHKYAGSSSVGGSATSAVKLDSSAGSATQPVYFSGGKPVATTYTLGKSVPSDAVFIDTWRGIQNNLTSDSTTDSLSAAQGKVLKGLVDGKAASSHGNHVPATQTANNAVFLRNDNTWQTVTPANIGAAASSHTHSSYVNQNAFSNVKVGSTTVSADTTTDTLTLAGSNVTLTPDATNDKVTIGITKQNVIDALGYTPGSSTDNNTTYTLTKSGSTITLTGSDGSKTSVTDSDTNIDTKVTQTVTTSNASYPLLLAPSGQTATTTTTSYFDSGVTLNPSTNTIAANVSGNSATATKLATARTISLTGSVTGSGTFDGSGNLSIATTTNHTHSYLPLSGGTVTGNILCSDKCSLGSDSSPFSCTSTKYLHANSIIVSDTLGSLTRVACEISSKGYLKLGSPNVENLGGKIRFCNDSCGWQYLEPCTSLGSDDIVKNYLPSKNGTLTVSSDITPTYTSALSDGSTKMFSQAGAYAMYSELNSNLAIKLVASNISDNGKITYKAEPNTVYLYVNLHFYANSVYIIKVLNSIQFNATRLHGNSEGTTPYETFSFTNGELSIQSYGSHRGYLYKINDAKCG